jgi:hypothetical protein
VALTVGALDCIVNFTGIRPPGFGVGVPVIHAGPKVDPTIGTVATRTPLGVLL